MKHGGRTWQDKIKSIWDRPTLDMHRLFMERLEGQLASCADGAATGAYHIAGEAAIDAAATAEAAAIVDRRKILFVTHVVQLKEFTVQNPGTQWKYFNAFLGSPEYGALAQRCGAKLAVCGHVHYRRRLRKAGTEFICPCLGYVTEWPAPAEPEKQIAETLQVFELGAQGATPLSLNT